MDTISILAALDEHYLPQLHVLLTSLRLNNPGEHMDLYLLQSAVSPEGNGSAPPSAMDLSRCWWMTPYSRAPQSAASTPKRCTTGCWPPACCRTRWTGCQVLY